MKKSRVVNKTNVVGTEEAPTHAVQIGEEEVPMLDELPSNEMRTSRLVSDMFAYMIFHSYDTAANMAKVTKSYPPMVENLLIDTSRCGFRGGAFTRAQLAKDLTSGRLKRDVMLALRETREGCPDRWTGSTAGALSATGGGPMQSGTEVRSSSNDVRTPVAKKSSRTQKKVRVVPRTTKAGKRGAMKGTMIGKQPKR